MALRNVASNFTFEQQRVEINEIASDLYALETGISTGNATLTGYLRGPASFTIDPATHDDNTGTVVIAGNLTVNGTTTTINSETLSVDDKIIRLGDVSTPTNDTADGGGIVLEAGATDHSFLYNKTDAAWVSSLKIKSTNGFEGTASGNAVLTGSTNNEIVTVTGANAIQGETKLTFTGALLDFAINNGAQGFRIGATGDHYPIFEFDANRSGAGSNCGQFDFKWNGTGIARIATLTGDDTSNKDNGDLTFHTSAAGTLAEALRITSAGKLVITPNVTNVVAFDYAGLYFSSDNSTVAEGLFLNNTAANTGDNVSISFSTDSGNRKKSAISHVDTGNYGRGDLIFSIDPDADGGELDITAHEKMRISSTGQVGINATTWWDSACPLTVYNGLSTSDHTILDIQADPNETSRVSFSEKGDTNKGSIKYSHGSLGNFMSFHTNGTGERLRITSSGQLVVGNNPTVDANTNLHVEDASGECGVVVEGNAAGAGAYLLLKNNSTSSDPRTYISGLDAGGQGTSQIEFWNLSDANNEGEMRFSTRPSGGGMTKALTLDSSQNAAFVGNVSALAFDGPTNIPRIDKSGTHTIVPGDAGHCITAAQTITLPVSTVMTQGDVISIYNASAGSAITIDAGGCTMNHAGVGAVTTLTLADMGLCTIWWISAGTCVISGSGLS